MRRKICLLAGAAVLSAALAAFAQQPDAALVTRARKLLDEVPLVDGHNDLPWEYRQRVQNHLDKIDLRADTGHFEKPMHTDIPRLRKGGVGGQFWSVYVPVELQGQAAVTATLEQVDLVHQMVRKYP
jgi:membrane dipeptidase